MSTSKPSKGQEVYEKVEAMVAAGSTKADAFRTLAEEYGQSPDSLRGAYHGHLRKQNGPGASKRTRKRETTPADAVELATAALRRSIEAIDAEIEAAAHRALEAQAEYEALQSSADARKKEIETKIAALAS